MLRDKILEISKDAENKSNKDLLFARHILMDEFEKTKQLIIDLTRHLEAVEGLYNKVNGEIKKRNVK